MLPVLAQQQEDKKMPTWFERYQKKEAHRKTLHERWRKNWAAEVFKRSQEDYQLWISGKWKAKSAWAADAPENAWDVSQLAIEINESQKYLESVQEELFPIGKIFLMTKNEQVKMLDKYFSLKKKGKLEQGCRQFFNLLKDRRFFIEEEPNAITAFEKDIEEISGLKIPLIAKNEIIQTEVEFYKLLRKRNFLSAEEGDALQKLLEKHKQLSCIISQDKKTGESHVTALSFLNMSEIYSGELGFIEPQNNEMNGFYSADKETVGKFKHLQSLLFENTLRYKETYNAAEEIKTLRHFRPSKWTFDEDIANMKNLNQIEILSLWECEFLYGDFISKFRENAALRILQTQGTAIQLRHLERLSKLKNFLYLQTPLGARIYKCQIPYYIEYYRKRGVKTLAIQEIIPATFSDTYPRRNSLGCILLAAKESRTKEGLKNIPQLDTACPTFKNAKMINNAIYVEFNNVESGLFLSKYQGAFEVAGEDKVFHQTDIVSITLEGKRIIIRNPQLEVTEKKEKTTIIKYVPLDFPIKHLRYAKNKKLKPNLFNADGFPAEPFEWSVTDSKDTKSQPSKP
jgi:hypothetical protein